MSSLQKNVLRIIASLGSGFLFLQAVYDFYQVTPGLGQWLGRFSLLWGIAFLMFTVSCILFFLGILLVLWFPGKTGRVIPKLTKARNNLGKFCWLIAAVAIIIPPVFLLFTRSGASFTVPSIRFLFLLTSSLIFAICITIDDTRLITSSTFFTSMITIASVFLIAKLLTNVTDYPFSLSWSEGNRFYDYSIYVDPSRYRFTDEIETPYDSPGRYILWGILFLIPGTPIWLHRLWDAILWSVPCLILGYLLSRWSNLDHREKWLYTLWIFLFLSQGPIYPPLILSAILIVLFVRSGRWVESLIAAMIASFYASSSRWTWLVASPSWASLILLTGFKLDSDLKWIKVLRGLIPIAAIALVSLGVASLASPNLFSTEEFSTSLAFSQPLLWYRLLPNSTYSYGIAVGVFLAIGPLAVLLLWMVVSKRWVLNWLQIVAGCGVWLVFLAMGIIASVKIGGGSNLHNLDMLLITLALLSAFLLRDTRLTSTNDWPILAKIMLFLLLFLPSWTAFSKGAPLEIPSQAKVDQALEDIRTKVASVQNIGEVLFIDQRQLVTFGYVKNTAMISEFEKKFLMDNAMAGKANYFSNFYDDLKDKRFALIITEPLFIKKQDTSRGFSEENNAWVNWVSSPILCYYQPKGTIEEVGIQFLLPRPNPKDCPSD